MKKTSKELLDFFGFDIGDKIVLADYDSGGVWLKVRKYDLVTTRTPKPIIYQFNEIIDNDYEIIKKPRFDEEEIEILKALKVLGYEWVAKDEAVGIGAYIGKPKKKNWYWFSECCNYLREEFDDKFQSIKWEDEEPVNIEEVLESLK